MFLRPTPALGRRTAVTAGEDRTVRLWEAATAAPRGAPLPHPGPVRAVAFSPDGATLVAASRDSPLALRWDVATGKPLGSPLKHSGKVLALAMSPDGQTILDVYEITYEGVTAPILLYLDEYHDGVLQAPQGFVCAAPIVVR